jgi:hypothetical protein
MLCPIEQDKRWIKLLSFLKNRQKALFYWNMYKENIPDYFYSNPTIISQIPESSEEVTNPSEAVPIKPGVEELFNSNPELANQVYKALGFQGNINSESNLKNTGKTEQELIEYLKQKYPELKLNISNNPVWEYDDDVFNQLNFKKVKNAAIITVLSYALWNTNAKIINNNIQYKNDLTTSLILKQLSSDAYLYIDINGNITESENNINTNAYSYLAKIWQNAGSPKITISTGSGKSRYNPLNNTITINVNRIDPSDGYVEIEKDKNNKIIGYVITPDLFIAEITHAIQASQGKMYFGKAILDFIKGVGNWNNTYEIEGTLENEAHSKLEPKIVKEFESLFKNQKNQKGEIIGQANIKAMTVLVDAVNKKADTIPHEYAHHYIAWFRDTPIVKEGIKRFGSEEALVQAIGEQVVKQKGEAYNWWKKFTNWILSLMSDKQLLQVLTDSFLNRQDLNNFAYNEITLSKETSIGWMFIQLNNKKIGRVKFVNNGEKGQLGLSIEINDEYQSKGYGQIVHTLMADLAKKDYKSNLYSDYQNSSQEIQLLNSLVKKGYAEKIGDIGKASKEYPDSFVTEERAFRIKTSDEIQQITPQQKQQAISLYSQYLDTIFPDSKVKDIVYHGSGVNIISKEGWKTGKETGTGHRGILGYYFSKYLLDAKIYAQRAGSPKATPESLLQEGYIVPAIVNAQTKTVETEVYDRFAEIRRWDENYKGFDSVTYGQGLDQNKEVVVKTKEQIHILGSKQDIEGFKEFVNGVTKDVESTSLFGLDTKNQEKLEFHINTLNVIGQFLEDIGVEQRLVPQFLSQDGSIIDGALAAANFIEGTVDIIDDINKRPSAWNKLPEEAAHFWYRLLDKNSELKKLLWDAHKTEQKAINLKSSQYGNTYSEFETLKEEAIGQLIAESIKRIEEKNAAPADYSFFKKFLEWINSIIDIFKNTTQDPFEVAAMKILSSDMSDLMTWEEYSKLNNIVNFADVLTQQSVAPIDYTLIEDIGSKETTFRDLGDEIIIGWVFLFNDSQKESPVFENHEDLDSWVSANVPEHNERQYALMQEVKDNQQFFDRLLNKTFRKKSKYLPKTLRKYFQIIDAQNLNPLREWNISQELQQITKKLSDEEKKQIIATNGYTNIAPTLKVLPDLLQKYGRKTTPEIIKQEIEITNKLVKQEITKEQATELRQKLENKKKGNPIVLSESIKIDGAKKQELSILNGIREMIKLENPNLKSITAEEFVAETHNWLETNYLLGFANEQSYLSYRTDQTFTYLNDRISDEDFQLGNMTEEEMQRLPFAERQRIANIVGLTKQNPDVYHNKVSLRFNDMYHNDYGQDANHFSKRPSAWGNLTYFYTGKNKWKDAVLLHEIQNDNIEALRNFKAQKVDLETSLGRYLQVLNENLIQNINQIETGGKKVVKLEIPVKNHLFLNEILKTSVDLNVNLTQGYQTLKQRINEQVSLYESDNTVSNRPEKAFKEVDDAYLKKNRFADLQYRGGIKSLLSDEDMKFISEFLIILNQTGYDLENKKAEFKARVRSIEQKINKQFQEKYGKEVPYIPLLSPIKTRTRAQIRQGVARSEILNENVKQILAFTEQKMNKELAKNIQFAKKFYVQARNATAKYNFNKKLSNITQEQYDNLIENYKYNQDLLNKLIDEQAQKDLKSPELEKIAKAKSIIKYLGDDSSVKLGKGKYGFIWDTADTDKGIVSVWDAYKAGNTNEDSYVDNWSVDEFLKYVKQVAPEYLTLDTTAIDVKNQEFKFDNLKQKALEKKAELEKDYGKIEEEVKQTLEIEMNYFTPLVHHLIQKHINQYGKEMPMYFSGYNITKLTQGNDRTALIYAGKDEINIVDRNTFEFNGKKYQKLGEGAVINVGTKEELRYFKLYNEYKVEDSSEIRNVTEQEFNKAIQEYEKAYQQATERRVKEIKVKAALQINLTTFPEISKNAVNVNIDENLRILTENELDLIIKKLNEYKKQSKQNLDRVVNTIMNISNSKPIETGAIYNAMTQISGIKLIWQEKIEGLQNNPGGYLVDLSNYNYNTPVLYGLDLSKKESNKDINLIPVQTTLETQQPINNNSYTKQQVNPNAVKQSIINRINSFNTLEELNQAWESPKFTNDQKAEYKEYFTKRKEVILAHMKRAEDFKNYVKNNTGIFKTIKLGEKYTEFEAQITGNISGGQIEVRTNTGKILLVNRNQVIDKIETAPSINVELENYVKSNKNIFKTVILGGKYEIFEAQVTGKISKGKVELKTNTGKLIQASLDQLRDLNKSTNNKDLSRLNHRLSKFEFSDELRVLYDQLRESYNYDTDKVHKDIISRSDVMFQPYFVNEQNELVGVYYYESETNPTFSRFAKSLSDARASFLRDAMNNGFKLNIIQKYSPLAKYYPAKLVSFYYSLTEDQLKKIDSMLKKEGYEKIEDLFNNKITLISEDDIIEILKCHI